MIKKLKKRKCHNCREYFRPNPRTSSRQKFCNKAECKKASKKESQKRWLLKPENRDHFRGPINVERVQEWRKKNPGYWKKRTKIKKDALQDEISDNAVKNQEVESKTTQDALQDEIRCQLAVITGLIGHLTGFTLQDEIANFIRKMRDSGNDILFGSKQTKGENDASKKTCLPRFCTANSQTIQLGGSSTGP